MTLAQIKQIRKTLGRTQEQMGLVIGIHSTTWHRWETGKTKPSKRDMATLEKLYTRYCEEREAP
jgi:DNA-binding XRE family transcriptional regulator